MTKVNGKGNIVSASFDGKAKKELSHLPSSKQLVLISIQGNAYCTGEYLDSIIKQAINSKVSTTFLIADEVYWHNLKEGSLNENEAALKQEALHLGDIYLNENLKYFINLFAIDPVQFNNQYPEMNQKIDFINQLAIKHSMNFEIIRWHEWMSKLDYFVEHKQKITSQYAVNETLKESIYSTAQKFANRRCERDKKEEKAEAQKSANRAERDKEMKEKYELWLLRSKGYLLEESPGVMWLAAALGYHFIVYPGDMIPCFQATKDFFIIDSHSDRFEDVFIHTKDSKSLVNWLHINFKRSEEKGKKSNNEKQAVNEKQPAILPQSDKQAGIKNFSAEQTILDTISFLVANGTSPEELKAALEKVIKTIEKKSHLAEETKLNRHNSSPALYSTNLSIFPKLQEAMVERSSEGSKQHGTEVNSISPAIKIKVGGST